jgi:hypothetical protein
VRAPVQDVVRSPYGHESLDKKRRKTESIGTAGEVESTKLTSFVKHVLIVVMTTLFVDACSAVALTCN